MTEKVRFGIDYLHALIEMNIRSENSSTNALPIGRMLLVIEWGLSDEEQDTASKEFWTAVDNKTLGNFSDAIERLIAYTGDNLEKKAKLLSHLIVITQLDGDISDDERELVFALSNKFDLRRSELLDISEKAVDILNALAWFAKNFEV